MLTSYILPRDIYKDMTVATFFSSWSKKSAVLWTLVWNSDHTRWKFTWCSVGLFHGVVCHSSITRTTGRKQQEVVDFEAGIQISNTVVRDWKMTRKQTPWGTKFTFSTYRPERKCVRISVYRDTTSVDGSAAMTWSTCCRTLYCILWSLCDVFLPFVQMGSYR